LKAQDLQTAKISETVFTMAHQMGLVKICLGTKSVKTTYTDYVNNESTDGFTNSTIIKIIASNVFTGNIPLSHANEYYFIGKKTTKPFFQSSSTGIRKWAEANIVPASNLLGNTCTTISASVAWPYDYFFKAYAYNTQTTHQVFSAKANTIYKMECWGSQGADHYKPAVSYHAATTHYGGRGGYVKGYISFTSSKTLWLYTGNTSGFNGGGVISVGQSTMGANGGGATDIRLAQATVSNWGGTASLRSRIIVAAGGGGANNRWSDGAGGAGTNWGEGDGGFAGGLIGGNGQSINHDRGDYYDCYGAKQNAGGTVRGYGMYENNADNSACSGKFGYAEVGVEQGGSPHIQSAGGGGWYGGAGKYHCGGSGGSSFLSGYIGCNGINSSNGSHTNQSSSVIDNVTYTYTGFSGYYHTEDMKLNAGNETFMSPTGSLTGVGEETGHTGTGYIIITECPLED